MAASRLAVVGNMPPITPNQTLYVTNLPSAKIKKDDLKTALYMLFSTYGPVLDVIALKTMKMRGQAHIVFRDVQAATQAMRALEGSTFLGMDLRIQYAKTKSDIVAKLDGTYKMPGSANANVEMNEAQQSIFNAPAPGTTSVEAPVQSRGLPTKPLASGEGGQASDVSGRGQKRAREEEDEEDSDEDVAMEEDSDDE